MSETHGCCSESSCCTGVPAGWEEGGGGRERGGGGGGETLCVTVKDIEWIFATKSLHKTVTSS